MQFASPISRLALAAAFALALLSLVGCTSDAEQEVREDSLTVGANATLVVRGDNGSVALQAIEGDTLSVSATLTSPARLDYRVTQAGDVVTVEVESLSRGWAFFSTSPRADLVISLPPDTRVDVHTSNGRVSADGLRAGGTLRTSNAGMDLEGIEGDLRARASNGSVEVRGFAGSLEVETSNGHIRASDVTGSARLDTSNGRIEFDGELEAGGENRFGTSNGSVTATLRGEPSVAISASTSNGSIDVGLPMETRLSDRNRLEGTAGGGDASLTIRTSNGSVRIAGE